MLSSTIHEVIYASSACLSPLVTCLNCGASTCSLMGRHIVTVLASHGKAADLTSTGAMRCCQTSSMTTNREKASTSWSQLEAP